MLSSRILVLIWVFTAILSFVIMDNGTGIVILSATALILIFCLSISRVTGCRLSFDINTEQTDDKKSRLIMVDCRNLSRIPVFSVSYDVSVHNLTTDERIAKRSTSENMFQIRNDHCGYLEISLTDVEIYDFLKFFRKSTGYDRSYTFVVPPDIKGIKIDGESPDSFDLESYEFSSIKKGDDPSEIFDLHEYRDGDKIRSVHWKLSSKLDEIIIKEHSYPVDNRIMIILNNSMKASSILTAGQRNDLIELFVSASAALVEKSMEHTLGWYDYYHDHFVQENIENMDTLWSAVPSLLKSGFRQDPVSAAFHYLEQKEGYHYTNYMYITENDDRDLDKLGDFGAVSIYEGSKYK